MPAKGQMKDFSERFWAKVEKTDDCWNWTAMTDPQGYGRFAVGGIPKLAHRVAYELLVGPIPQGKLIDHTCYKPACVRPSHLRPVTAKQNQENRAGVRAHSRSGVRGVVWSSQAGKWMARVGHNRKQYNGGFFSDVSEAAEAIKELRNRLFTHNDLDRKGAA